jgi:putative lipoic acid-binding regulatory protein
VGSDDPGQVDGQVGQGQDEEDAEAAARARAVDLLEATHEFPCHYAVTVIAFNRAVVTEAIIRAATFGAGMQGDEEGEVVGDSGYQARASREGKYLSHRFAVRVSHAREVLELYARLRSVEGVVTLL